MRKLVTDKVTERGSFVTRAPARPRVIKMICHADRLAAARTRDHFRIPAFPDERMKKRDRLQDIASRDEAERKIEKERDRVSE